MNVAIIGAGLAGLVLANKLCQQHQVKVFEKSWGPGGRLATRTTNPYYFDHGSQFFISKSEKFKET